MEEFMKQWIGLVLSLTLIIGCTPVAYAEGTAITEINPKHSLSSGQYYSIAKLHDGTIAAWGMNLDRQLGGTTSTPSDLIIHTNYKSGAAGYNASIFLKEDGTVFTCGGPGDEALHQVSGINDVVEVYSGWNGSFFVLKTDGTLWSWAPGAVGNSWGLLGHANTNQFDLGQVSGLSNVKYFDTQMKTCFAVLANGTVWGWGCNDKYQIAGTTSTSSVYTPRQLPNLENIVSVSDGVNFGTALKSDGTVWTWGNNENGQLGNGSKLTYSSYPVQVTGLSNVIAIDAGDGYGLALKNDGTVWAWGRNDYGQLGDCTTTNRSTPVQVKGLNNVTEISGGASHSLARKSDGSIWGWGYGAGNILLAAMGTYISRPIQIFDGDPDNNNNPPATNIPTIKQIFTGENHTFALCVDGTLWAWGKNAEGQLGVGSTGNKNTPVQITGIGKVISVVPGLNHTFIFCEDGSIWTWGKNDQGQLGIGNTENQFIPVRLQ